ncbi:MAG: hypothetical protein P4L74_01370 [Candidatus Doudnabacteria bacterium]|nr:hypothetical protein [Candidatus Doudnabacteria bacterium]
MDKQQLLSEISQMAQSGQVSHADVMSAFSGAPTAAHEIASSKNLSIAEILYYIGGAIVFLGIIVLCYQNWDNFSSFLRIFITLGSSIASLIVAVLLNRYENLKKPSDAFFLLFGMLAPLGVGVTFKEAGFDLSSNVLWVAIYAMLTAVFFGIFWYFKQKVILLFFSIAFATALFHYLIAWLVGESLSGSDYSKVWEYQILVIGLVYMLVGRYLAVTAQKALVGVLYGFGSLFFLGSALALGGWQPNQNAFWELIYPLVVFGVIFLSVYAKSKAFLVFGTIFLIGYILKLTGEYFTSGLGWPLALVLAGLLIMLVGYYAVRINRKYLIA